MCDVVCVYTPQYLFVSLIVHKHCAFYETINIFERWSVINIYNIRNKCDFKIARDIDRCKLMVRIRLFEQDHFVGCIWKHQSELVIARRLTLQFSSHEEITFHSRVRARYQQSNLFPRKFTFFPSFLPSLLFFFVSWFFYVYFFLLG